MNSVNFINIFDKFFASKKHEKIMMQNLLNKEADLLTDVNSDCYEILLENNWITPAIHNPNFIMNRDLENMINFYMYNSGTRNFLQNRIENLHFSPHITSFIQGYNRSKILIPYILTEIATHLFRKQSLNLLPLKTFIKPEQKKENLSMEKQVEDKIKMNLIDPLIIKNTSKIEVNTLSENTSNPKVLITHEHLNREMTKRKKKKLHQHSKKRHRRKKSKNSNSHKELDHNVHTIPEKKVNDSQNNSAKISSKNALSKQTEVPDATLSSFFVSLETTNDDDWDTANNEEIFTDIYEFEFSGLFIPQLSSTIDSFHCTLPSACNEDLDILCKVNKKWNDSMQNFNNTPKVPSKVSFAPDEELVEIVSIENYDRKGEWERYATDRLRFKKRIEELEPIIAPCLLDEHRLQVYIKYFNL